MRYLMALVLALAVPFAIGADATSQLTWEPPTARVDDTALAAQEIAEYRVYYAVDGNVTTDSTMVTIGPDATSESVTIDLQPRQDLYTVNFAITTVDTDGRESALSDVASKTFNVDSTAAPNPPKILDIISSCGDGCTIEQTQLPNKEAPLASPTNQISDSKEVLGFSNSPTVSLPSNVNFGDVIAVFVLTRTTPTITTSASGWVSSSTSVDAGSTKTNMKAFFKDADGNESGTSITINFNNSVDYAIYAVRITGSKPISARVPDVKFAFANVDEAQGDPPSLSPSEGAQDYLWFGLAGTRTDDGISSWDANYSNTGSIESSNTFANIGYMDRQLNAATEDPGPIGFTVAGDWSAMTVAFHPPVGTPSGQIRKGGFGFSIVGR